MRYIDIKKTLPCLFALFADEFESAVAYPLLIVIFVMSKNYFPTTTDPLLRDLYFSLVILLPSLFKIIGTYIFGDISDFLGRKKALLACIGSGLFCMTLMYCGMIWNSIMILMLSRILSGLTSGREAICQAVIADISTHANKTNHMKLLTLSRAIGLILGSIVSSLMMKQMGSHINIAIPFYMAMVTTVITLYLILFGFSETFNPVKQSRLSFKLIISGISIILHNKIIRTLLIATFFLKFGIGTYFNIAAIYLKENFHNPAWLMGYFYSFMGMGYIAGILIILPFLSNRLPTRKVVLTTSLLQGILMLATGIFHSNIWAWSVAISVGALDFAGYTALLALVSNVATKEHQGMVMGSLMAVTAFAFMISGACFNLITNIHSSGLVTLSGITTLIAVMLFIKLK